MIGISTVLFDLDGYLVFSDKNIRKLESFSLSRRVSSTKTLDGGSYVSDLGYSPTDENILLELLDLSKGYVENLTRLTELHSRFRVSTSRGAFECIPKNVVYSSGVLKISFVVVGLISG